MVDRTTRYWDAIAQSRARAATDAGVSKQLEGYPALVAFFAVDPQGDFHWLTRPGQQTTQLLLKQLSLQRLPHWYKHLAQHPDQAHFGASRLLDAGLPWNVIGRSFTVQGSTWYLLAIQDSNELIGRAVEALPSGIGIRVREEGVVFYDTIEPETVGALGGDIDLQLHDDLAWQLQWRSAFSSQPLLARLFPNLLFLGGLIFSVLLSRSLMLSSVLRTHAMQLEHRSLHDALTRLPNKKMLAKTLPEYFGRLGAVGASLWVVALDLNGLKLINDSLGHTIGDQVLKQAAKRIAGGATDAELVVRLEGDEFVLVYLNSSSQQVAAQVQQVMAAVGEPYHIDGMELRVTASAGLTSTRHGVHDPLELVREAVLAMAWAERDGINSVHRYSPELSVSVQERLSLRTELQNALEHQQFELYYQPIVDARAGQIVGVEALLRWPHPSRGLISPRYFIDLAEDTGQIVPLSNWVVDTACRDISLLRQRNLANFPVVVNVSPLHFRRADFVSVLQTAIEKYRLPEGALDLEITEGMVIEHTEEMFDKLNRIRELGVRVSIDDFGTGYSSLGYLKSLPIDKIKIDQSFVRDVISDRRDAAITKSIIGLAHHLNLKVVAEGVETEAQFWFLKRNFCDEVQGYLFQRPVAFDDFSQLLYEQGGRVALPASCMPSNADKVLLLLDDEPNILRALTRLLRRDGYRILTANTPQQAFALLAQNDVQVVMSDQRMPEMTGTEFFRRVKEMYPDTIRLILSGYTDLKSVTDAINHGAIYRFLTKPWDDEELRREIAEAFKGYQAQDFGS